MEQLSKQDVIDHVSDLCMDFLYYDRKESETMSFNQLKECVQAGVITIDEMVDEFRNHLTDTLTA